MRWLVLLLVLANVAFFALAQGWLAPLAVLSTSAQREPQRLAAQVQPQALRIVATGAATAAAASAATAAAAAAATAAATPDAAPATAGACGAVVRAAGAAVSPAGRAGRCSASRASARG